MPERRIFTLGEARATLPEIASAVTAMVRRVRRARQLAALRDSMRRNAGGDGGPGEHQDDPIQAEFPRLRDQIAELVDYIRARGVEVKDIDRGLVDWVAIREGREVYLCWQHGERDIAHWHDLDAGFAGRQPIRPEEWP